MSVSVRRLALAGLVAVVAAGCGGGGGPSAAEIVSRSAASTATVKSFHLVVDIRNVRAPANGISVTFVDGDMIVPDKLRARIAGTWQGAPLSSELVVLGKTYYLKNPFSGKWQVIDVGLSPLAFFDPAKGVLAVIKGAQDVSRHGSERVGTDDSYRLSAKVRADALRPLLGNAASEKLLPVELWIGKKDTLLRRIRLSGPISPSESANAVRTVELSAFGEQVRIVAPSVK